MPEKNLSETMLRMLRNLSREPNSTSSLPYVRGAANTADALRRRGLLHMWPKNGGYMIALTDAGRMAVKETG